MYDSSASVSCVGVVLVERKKKQNFCNLCAGTIHGSGIYMQILYYEH
jgi:hypothetical protein